MKSKNVHWLILLGLTLFSFEIFSMGNGAGGSRPFTCPAGQHAEGVRSGRSVSNVCVDNPVAAPVVEVEVAPAPPPPTVSSSGTAARIRKPAKKKDPCDNGDGFVTSPEGGCVPPNKSEDSEARASSTGITPTPEAEAAPTPAPAAVAAPAPAPEPVASGSTETKDPCDTGDGFVTSPDGNGCVPPTQSDATKARANSTGTQAVTESECFTQFQQERDTCLSKATEASGTCDEENDTMQTAANASKIIGAGSAVSIQMACSKLGEISKVANAGFGVWQSACAMSQKSCESSCSNAQKLRTQTGCIPPSVMQDPTQYAALSRDMGVVVDNIRKCVSYKSKINQAAQHAIAVLAQLQASKQCQNDTNSLTTNNLDQCKTNPNNPLCTDAQRCSNADFASKNQVCKCINTPNAAECIAKTSAAGTPRVAAGGLNPGSHVAGTDAGTTMIGDGGAGAAMDAFGNSLRDGAAGHGDSANLGGQKGNAGLSGGSSGGGGGGSGANGGGGPGAGGPGGDPGDKLKINSGYIGSGGGGGGYLARTGGPGVGPASVPNAGGVNFNKMAGNQFDPKRYIAGLNGKSGEMINGPGSDIFVIVKHRIEANKSTLLDPDFRK